MNKKVNRKKILHIIPCLGIGGAEKLMFDLARFTDRKNYDFTVIAIKAGGYYADKIKELGIAYYLIGKNTRLGLIMFFKLYKKIKQINPDLIYLHLFGASFWGSVAARAAGIKNVAAVEHNTEVDESKIKTLIKTFIVCPLCNKAVAVSMAVKNYIVKKYNIPQQKVCIIYNGIDIDRFEKQNRLDDNIILGALSRLAPQKGHAILLDAFAKVKNENIKLLIAGSGPLRAVLRKQAENLDITERVEFVGEQEDQIKFLNNVDIFIAPSLWEGLGIAILEAMATGKIVIASRVGGIAEVIKDGINGFLAEPGNSEALAEKILFCLENFNNLQSIRAQARETVVNNFDIKDTAKQYQELANYK